ncbi:MAG: helix-turn-helix domain-containing protein [Candidatus Aminicenantes bacterium]|nr:MAG: helix-turn-helix domain-containing protein [Candidatus Aminicenantes bacterium]
MQGIRFYLIVVILVLSFLPLPLVSLDPEKAIDQYLMDEWKIPDGLPANTIRAITQTPDGFLWLGAGSNFVLVRFDGITFKVFKNETNLKIKNSTIYEFFLDQKGTLWIGSSQGLTRFRPQQGDFKTFSVKDGIQGNGMFCICEDMKGNLWIGSDDGYLNRFKNGTFTAFNAAMGIENNWISSILEDNKGNLWLGTAESGLLEYQYGKLVKHPIKGIDNNYSITYLFEDPKGILWLGTNKGLVKSNHTTTTFYTTREGLSNNHITNIIEDNDGNLWVGTLNGINRLKKGLAGNIIIEKYLENNFITCLFEDREKSLWIGTNGSGMKRLRNCQVKTYTTADGLNNDFLLSLYEDTNGDIWIGSCVGVNRFDGKSFLKFDPIADHVIIAINRDQKGNLWISTYGKGLVRVFGRETITYTEEDGFMSNYVTSIHCDSKNRTWFGTDKGLILYHHRHFKSYTFADGVWSNIIVFIYEDEHHNMWVGTADGLRVLSLKDEEINTKNLKTYFNGTLVTSIYEDPSGIFWLGTDGVGLKRINITPGGVEIFSYQVEHGLNSNKIYKVLEDENERLWMSSDLGIIKVSRKELEELAKGSIHKINCVLYGISDGMKNPECIYSAIKTRNGELWFATKKGIVVFQPNKMKINKLPPPVIIEKIIVDRQLLPKNQDNRSFRSVSNIEFHFTAPTFIAPGKVKFKTKLEGYDNQWHLVSPAQKRIAGYSDLPSGEYQFKVIAGNRDGIWNNTGDSFFFSIKRYFYQGTFFKISIFLSPLFIGIILFYFLRKHPFLKKFKRKYKTSTLDPEKTERYLKKLFYMTEVEKVYKDEELSLQSLAEKLSIPPRELSQVINERLDMNYSNFINSYRIEEAKNLLFAPGENDHSILDIAYQVGFNSKAVFNRAFKKFTGMTPSQFRKNNINGRFK